MKERLLKFIDLLLSPKAFITIWLIVATVCFWISRTAINEGQIDVHIYEMGVSLTNAMAIITSLIAGYLITILGYSIIFGSLVLIIYVKRAMSKMIKK